jgi:uncharacterized protein with NRDE domain
MCLVVLAWKVHPELPLILAGNRDEFHDRPAAAADWWEEPEGVLGGRDLEAGGSWLAIHRDGRFAVVTNFREPPVDMTGRRTRGELVIDFVASDRPVATWAGDLADRQRDYGGFSLIIGDREGAYYLNNRGDALRPLDPGIHGLSNNRLNAPWPKVEAARRGLAALVDAGEVSPESLFDLLADTSPAPDDRLPETGVPLKWERRLSPVFIIDPRYGTRASTLLLMGVDGAIGLIERRFDRAGRRVGESRFEIGPGVR